MPPQPNTQHHWAAQVHGMNVGQPAARPCGWALDAADGTISATQRSCCLAAGRRCRHSLLAAAGTTGQQGWKRGERSAPQWAPQHPRTPWRRRSGPAVSRGGRVEKRVGSQRRRCSVWPKKGEGERRVMKPEGLGGAGGSTVYVRLWARSGDWVACKLLEWKTRQLGGKNVWPAGAGSRGVAPQAEAGVRAARAHARDKEV